MASLKIAAILRKDGEFILVKQTPPPKFGLQEYDSFVDSDLWDLPSADLTPITIHSQSVHSTFIFQPQHSFPLNLDFTQFDVHSALLQVLQQVGFGKPCDVDWKLLKFLEEPAFGPGLSISTVFITGTLRHGEGDLQGQWKWMSIKSCLNCLSEVKPSSDRIGPLAVFGFINDSVQSTKLKLPSALNFQEYPPGVKIIPMSSRTAKPFRTTNLVIFAPDTVFEGSSRDTFVCHGDALIVDPGCWYEDHEKLTEIIASLPRKLIVLVTHHHRDHIDGLSVVQKSNPDAVLLTHENTMACIKKDCWSLGYTPVSGGEEICIGDQQLRIIFAPGHTDGHMGLLHISTHSLIVGDHCVGQGSAILDITSGGNMHEYFETTYKFIEISPHVLIPMHGRINLWPKHMLCSYLKNRRARESTILKAIEGGGMTLFDIVAYTYADVDCYYWYPAASNVRLHVDHLAQQDKLPKDFSIQMFEKSCGLRFMSRWLWSYLSSHYVKPKMRALTIIGAVSVAGFAVLYSLLKYKSPSQIKEHGYKSD